jgi:hypothetical protein
MASESRTFRRIGLLIGVSGEPAGGRTQSFTPKPGVDRATASPRRSDNYGSSCGGTLGAQPSQGSYRVR